MPYHTPETLPAAFICRRLRIPNDLAFIMAVNGALAELVKEYNWEQTTDITPAQAAGAALSMLLDTLDSECPDETPEPGEKLIFTPDASLITYAPQDPFTAPETVPIGYVSAPFYEIQPAAPLPFPGTAPGDVLTDLAKLPTAWPPLLPPDGYPRFRIHFHVTGPGPGEVEIHLVKLPLAGLALISLDGDVSTVDFVDLATVDLLDITDLLALLGTAIDGDLVRTHIQEMHVAAPGDHFIDVTFLPKITSSSLLGFGGGLRQVILGGTAEAGLMPAPQFRLTGTILEWRPTDAHVWLALGDLAAQAGAGIENTVVNMVDYDDPAALTFDDVTGTLTLDLPAAPPETPGILATVLNNVSPETPAALNFNALTKTLTLDLPGADCCEIRFNPTGPTGAPVVEVYDPVTDTWEPQPSPPPVEPLYTNPPAQPARPEPVNERQCAAATNAAHTYYQFAHELAREADIWGGGYAFIALQFGQFAAPFLNLALSASWFEGLSTNTAFTAQVISTLTAIQAEAILSPQGDLSPYLVEQFNSTTLQEMVCAFYNAADANGIIDYATALTELASPDYPNLIGVHHALVEMMGPGGLAAAASAQLTDTLMCDECVSFDWGHEWDMTVSQTATQASAVVGTCFTVGSLATWVSGQGYQDKTCEQATTYTNAGALVNFGGTFNSLRVYVSRVEADIYTTGVVDSNNPGDGWAFVGVQSTAGRGVATAQDAYGESGEFTLRKDYETPVYEYGARAHTAGPIVTQRPMYIRRIRVWGNGAKPAFVGGQDIS